MNRRETFDEYFARVMMATGFPVSTDEMRLMVLAFYREGYSVKSIKEFFEECLDAVESCDHYAQINAETMVCDFCGEYCGPGTMQ